LSATTPAFWPLRLPRGSSTIDDSPVLQEDDPVGVGGDARVVGDDDHRPPPVVGHLAQQPGDLFRRVGVQVARRLVGQHQGRVGHQGAGHGHALLLAAGELVGPVVGAPFQADLVQPFGRPRFGRGRPHAVEGDGQGGVLQRVEHRDEVEELEDEADAAAADFGQLGVRQVAQVVAVNQHRAAGGPVQPAQQVEQRGLAATARPHDGHELARLDLQRDAIERRHGRLARAVDFLQIVGCY
jgi:hypothetical protein